MTPEGYDTRRASTIVTGVDVEGDPAHVTLRLAGEIDQLNAEDLIEATEPYLRAGIADITVDLREVVFIDSAGIGRIIGLWKRGRATGVPVRLVARHEAVVALVDLAGLGRFMEVAIVPGPRDGQND